MTNFLFEKKEGVPAATTGNQETVTSLSDEVLKSAQLLALRESAQLEAAQATDFPRHLLDQVLGGPTPKEVAEMAAKLLPPELIEALGAFGDAKDGGEEEKLWLAKVDELLS